MAPSAARPRGSSVPRSLYPAFTVVELAVVIAIIVLVIALAVPAFNSMSEESRYAQAVQSINGILTRAHIAAIGERSMMAVRFCPAVWDVDQTGAGAADKDRQTAVTYRYFTSVERPDNPTQVFYDERFVRREDSPTVRLPKDVWVAPAEGLLSAPVPARVSDPWNGDTWAQFVLGGQLCDDTDAFVLDAGHSSVIDSFLDADDFLVVFDPHTGLMGGGRPTAYGLRSYRPDTSQESGGDWNPGNQTWTTEFRRFAFTGLVIYPREPFAELGDNADPLDRQNLLRRLGRSYYINRHSGVLVEGQPEGL